MSYSSMSRMDEWLVVLLFFRFSVIVVLQALEKRNPKRSCTSYRGEPRSRSRYRASLPAESDMRSVWAIRC